MQLPNDIRIRFIPAIDESAVLDGTSLSFGWWLEEVLARIRWCAVPICIATVFLFPGTPAWLLLLPAFGYGLGNVAVTSYLRQPRSVERLRSVRALATTIDWLSAFGSIYAFSAEPAAATPAILLLLVVTTALRFQMAGLIFAALVTLATVSILSIAQVFVFEAIDTAQALMIVGSWVVVVGVVVLVLGVLSTGLHMWQTQEQVVREDVREIATRLQVGLTDREWQVLSMLPQQHLTYEDIGHELSISPGTVKAHVRNIGEKLGVRGRNAVVAKAYRVGLLSAEAENTPNP